MQNIFTECKNYLTRPGPERGSGPAHQESVKLILDSFVLKLITIGSQPKGIHPSPCLVNLNHSSPLTARFILFLLLKIRDSHSFHILRLRQNAKDVHVHR